MGALVDLKRDLIYHHMLGAVGAGNVDFSEVNADSLSDVPLQALLQQDYSLPKSALSQSVSRFQSGPSNSAILVSARAHQVAIPLVKGMRVSSISVHSAGTALVSGTFQKFGLYDLAGNRLAVTNDDGATAWAAETVKTLALTAPYVVPSTGIYYVAILVVATTVPSLRAVASNNYAASLLAETRTHRPAQYTVSTALADLPNPIGAISNAGGSGIPYVFVS